MYTALNWAYILLGSMRRSVDSSDIEPKEILRCARNDRSWNGSHFAEGRTQQHLGLIGNTKRILHMPNILPASSNQEPLPTRNFSNGSLKHRRRWGNTPEIYTPLMAPTFCCKLLLRTSRVARLIKSVQKKKSNKKAGIPWRFLIVSSWKT